MKIQKKQEPIKFQPVTIEITLETQEEVDMLKELYKYDMSILDAVFEIMGVSRVQAGLLGSILSNVRPYL